MKLTQEVVTKLLKEGNIQNIVDTLIINNPIKTVQEYDEISIVTNYAATTKEYGRIYFTNHNSIYILTPIILDCTPNFIQFIEHKPVGDIMAFYYEILLDECDIKTTDDLYEEINKLIICLSDRLFKRIGHVAIEQLLTVTPSQPEVKAV